MSCLKLLFALHDVTPFHRSRIERAEAFFADWGIEKAAYLIIPKYHGRHLIDDGEFGQWCRQPRPFAVEWALHGFYHLRCTERATTPDDASESCVVNEGDEREFERLDDATSLGRLLRGREAFTNCLGAAPTGFVAPVWSFRPSLTTLLQEAGFGWTEDRRGVSSLSGGRRGVPVITWATRTALRKQISLWGVPVLAAWWRRVPVLRIAVHPFDFDHPKTIRSIERVVRQAAAERTQLSYAEYLAD